MPAGVTYTPIATATVSGTNTCTFSSIPSTYTDLILVVTTQPTANGSAYARVNGDAGSNYSSCGYRGTGSAAAAYTRLNDASFLLSFNGITSTSRGQWILQFNNYANTSVYKTMLNRFNWVDSEVVMTAGSWRSTAAINSITTFVDGGNFGSGTTATLYGIASA